MDKTIEKIGALLDQFTREEIGNRLSQFSMIALKEMIINELKNSVEDEGSKKKE